MPAARMRSMTLVRSTPRPRSIFDAVETISPWCWAFTSRDARICASFKFRSRLDDTQHLTGCKLDDDKHLSQSEQAVLARCSATPIPEHDMTSFMRAAGLAGLLAAVLGTATADLKAAQGNS